MNKFTKFLKSCFVYNPTEQYNFVLNENNANSENVDLPDFFLPDHDIYSNLNKNYDYLRVQYNTLINSDIIMRPFQVDILGKKYNALFIGIDGMISSQLVNNFLLRPLMENKDTLKINHTQNGIEYKKVPQISIEDYIFNKLLQQNSVKKSNKTAILFYGCPVSYGLATPAKKKKERFSWQRNLPLPSSTVWIIAARKPGRLPCPR